MKEFYLHVNEISFSYERTGTKTCFEEEVKGSSEMAYCFHNILVLCKILNGVIYCGITRGTCFSFCLLLIAGVQK